MNDDPVENVQRMFNNIDSCMQVSEKLEESFSDLDTTLNIKVNSLLKAEFEKLCKKNHSNLSRELKFFMLRSVKQNRLN